MNRVDVLCDMSRFMMESFSQRTVDGLAQHTLFRLALPRFQSFLDINVGKEVEKDRRVITCAARLHETATTPGPEHVSMLLREARKVDEGFVRQAAVFPVDISIRYHEIEHYRQQRIEIMLVNSYRLLGKWAEKRSFRDAVGALYDEAGFQALLQKILQLYAAETRNLSSSIRLPSLLSVARDAMTQTITGVMEHETRSLSLALTQTVYPIKADSDKGNQEIRQT
jgi:hypothetical protein